MLKCWVSQRWHATECYMRKDWGGEVCQTIAESILVRGTWVSIHLHSIAALPNIGAFTISFKSFFTWSIWTEAAFWTSMHLPLAGSDKKQSVVLRRRFTKKPCHRCPHLGDGESRWLLDVGGLPCNRRMVFYISLCMGGIDDASCDDPQDLFALTQFWVS